MISDALSLTIIVPVYNELRTLPQVLVAVSRALPGVFKEVLIVDDGSTDGTREWLRANFPDPAWQGNDIAITDEGALHLGSERQPAELSVRPIYSPGNAGKGDAIRSGLANATGDITVIQDADLEYDPGDWTTMYDLIARRHVADVVYGSRFYGRPHRSLYFHHFMANRLISLIYNLLYNQTLTDIECCYKMFTRAVRDGLELSCSDFGCEIEISAQIARGKRWRIYEVGISYFGRTYEEGKKITWRDGVLALWYLLRFRFSAYRLPTTEILPHPGKKIP